MVMTYRGLKGSSLTHAEMDDNFSTLVAVDSSHAASTAAHGVAGSVVGTTDTQTLTNKTIVAASNTVTTAPSGNLSAVELNAALAELQGDIDTRATSTALTTHINNATGAHAASAVSNTPAGTIAATNVQDAINELDTDIGAHLTDAVAAHAASAVSNTPAGNIAATDVQAAINELDTEKQPLNTTLTAISDATLGAFSHRNKIINGGFAVNQRAYVSGAATTAGQYTLDRWKVTGTGGITFSTTANKTTVTIPSGQAFQQVIEGLNLQSGTYVMSWEGTAQGKIGAGSLSASGVTGSITGGTNTTIEFGPGTVANVQFEFGSVATPFEHRHYGTELDLCQRYYETGNIFGFGWAGGAGTSRVARSTFAVTKRATPTIALSGLSYANCSSANAASINSDGFGVTVTATAAGAYALDAIYAAGAEL